MKKGAGTNAGLFSSDSVGARVIRARARWLVTGVVDNAASGHELPRLV
jgi:hypothetical protein